MVLNHYTALSFLHPPTGGIMGTELTQYQIFLDFRQMIGKAVEQAWEDSAFMQALAENPVAAFQSQFGYTFPYSCNLTMVNNAAIWNSDFKNWIINQNNYFILQIPPAPSDPDQYDVAIKVYHNDHWTFTGNGVSDYFVQNPNPLTNKHAPTEETLTELGNNIAAAIKLTWTMPEFKNSFRANPLLAMENYLHYRMPGIFSILAVELIETPMSRWAPEKETWILPPNTISFSMPITPDVLEPEYTVATAKYLDAASGYFLVCC
jgi:ribosomally synthesized peptide (two-chain TOMM family)